MLCILLLILLINQKLSQRVSTLTSSLRSKRSGRINNELPLEYLTIDYSHYSLTKIISNLNQFFYLNLIFIFDIDFFPLAYPWMIMAIECGFDGITVEDTELFKHYQSACRFFIFFICKFTVGETEKLVFLVQEIRYYPD